jgi:capsid protein
MAADFLDPIYEMWLSEEIAAGRITAPGWSDPLLRMAWLSCEWAGAPMPNIDPSATAKADQMYIEMGAQTPDDVARNLNGSSGKANRAKNARQLPELTPVPWTKGAEKNTEEEKSDA